MNINRVDLNLLAVMKVLHECRSTTRAAEILHLSQPAISHALKRMRDTFDDPLFERRGRTMVPTAKAERLLAAAGPALARLDTALAALDRFDPATSEQRFVIGLNNAFENIILPPLLSRLALDAPRLRLAGQGTPRNALIGDLTSGAVDLAIDTGVHLNDRIDQRHLLQCGYIVIGRQNHPALRDGLTLERYLRARHLLVSRRTEGPGLEDERLLREGQRRDIAIRCQSLWTACQVVARTDYLLTMPRLFLHQTRHLHDFAQADFPLPGLVLDVFLYWHRSRTADPGNRWLRDEVATLVRTDLAAGGLSSP